MSHMKDLQIQLDNESHDAPTPREFCDCGHRIGDYGCPLCGE